ncbi:MAG: adenylate/guanylate cyclase domain-containing protein [Candidatus Thiodiazotropha lotti]|uniref:Adenylate/guanylate cyclase domain-containing protein n=1 Tax=Candidatus Thiodiazotropha lotti TaxID=2792787 RepID=A0A9E4K8E2_9GAMM|nr:adenylate/guanylate cyclase domain-containing protein [Candidatus Thiodiazotropha lotti]MCG7941137.1 adenylate/guanylate cyclase domain-containing protein [Candidatus Thiodiazotropha lotti]MCW4205612.1 adenylate/guanylate cyclase domain-containing protein [Candidatus Thiodiazotropha lotti]
MEKHQLRSALLLGISIGILGALISLLPVGSAWEEDMGLGLLFKLRGQRAAPESIEIVSINGETAAQLGLSEEIPEWPRSLHADLIEQLNRAGVRLIVFDIFFKKARAVESDRQLAETIRQSGNVLLVSYQQQQQVKNSDGKHTVEQLIPPTAILADAALELAPFVLPKVPVKVSRFWTFSGNQQRLSLPAAALLHAADPGGDRLKQLLLGSLEPHKRSLQAPNLDDLHEIALFLRNNPALIEPMRIQLEEQHKLRMSNLRYQQMQSVINLFEAPTYPHLNFYGPPGSIKTHSFQEILASPADSLKHLRDKTLFIGYAGAYQPKQKDGFYTVFSQSSGLDISGVEIAATAYANLLYQEVLHRPHSGWIALLMITFGVGISLLFRFNPGLIGVIVGMVVGGSYFGSTYLLFNHFNLWLPWFIPLVIQLPAALIVSLIWHYQQMRTSREHLRRLFGYYLPGDVIEKLARDNKQPAGLIESAYGVCLASDAQNYTAMAEKMEPKVLQEYLNRYFKILFTPVRANKGIVSDVVGDAMLAIWPATEINHNMEQMACEAALAIGTAIQNSDLAPKLFTRIGLHAGELVMSHVGAIDHFEYRAVGDMVNTTSRIENLNKLLGTRILASEDFVKHLKGIQIRELGLFSVSGKEKPINIFEIAAKSDSVDASMLSLHQAFAEALLLWQMGERPAANRKFQSIAKDFPSDGPTNYYINQFADRRSTQKRKY